MPESEVADIDLSYPPREERRPVELRGWLVRRGGVDAHDFLIDNLSYGGCRLQSEARLARGDVVHLTVHHRGAIPAHVRWHNGHGVGLSFAPDEPEKKQIARKVDRVPLHGESVVRRAGGKGRVIDVTDFSRLGCCLTFDVVPAEAESIWVALPGLAPVEARVRWVKDRRAGVEFAHAIHPAVYDLLLLRWGVGD